MYGLMPAPCPPAVLAAELAATTSPRERPQPAPEDRAARHGHLDGQRLIHAERVATERYPGPVGELLKKELQLWRSESLRFVNGSLVHRLVDHLLAPGTTP